MAATAAIHVCPNNVAQHISIFMRPELEMNVVSASLLSEGDEGNDVKPMKGVIGQSLCMY